MAGHDKTDILVDLIKMNEENTNKKMDMLGEKLISHIDDNKNDFNEIKGMINNLGSDIKEGYKDLYENTISPIHKKLEQHTEDIRNLKDKTKGYVKVDLCKQNEEVIKAFFMKYIKRLVIVNIIFFVVYIILLYNSNVTIDWNHFWGMIGMAKKAL